MTARQGVLVLLLLVSNAAALASGDRAVAESATEVCPLLPGMKVPEVTFKTVEGADLKLAEAVARKPAVLIFYRGGW